MRERMDTRRAGRGVLGMALLVVWLAAWGGPLGTPTAWADEPVHWSYEGEAGPEHWGELSADWTLCAGGTEQSPVDIPAGVVTNAGSGLELHYQPSALDELNNGHTIQVNYEPGSTLVLDSTPYELLQFHFHTPSEHTLAGQHTPLELHLVHRNAAGGLAVVGVLVQAGAENPAFAPVLSHLPATAGEELHFPAEQVDAGALLPSEHAFFRYNGSLTTPPCSEGVKWHVLTTPITMSAAQIEAVAALEHVNARPIQPFNARTFLAVAEATTPAVLPTSGAAPAPTPAGAGPLFGLGGTLLALGAVGYLVLGRARR